MYPFFHFDNMPKRVIHFESLYVLKDAQDWSSLFSNWKLMQFKSFLKVIYLICLDYKTAISVATQFD